MYVREAGSLGNELGSYRCVMGLDARAAQANHAPIAETPGIALSVRALHGQQEGNESSGVTIRYSDHV